MKILSIPAISIYFMYCFFSQGRERQIYYIYVKPNDKLYQKQFYTHGISMDYLCYCHANKKGLRFAYIDTGKKHLSSQLPDHYYSMIEFATLVNKAWEKFRESEFWNDLIYIIEENKDHSYCYYPVKFYPAPHEE